MHANLAKEKALWEKGYDIVCGVDEAGRGPLAGPVVAAAVVLPKDFNHPEINDSKQLSKKKREQYKKYIEEHALYIGISIVDNQKIDEINILEASRYAMIEAIYNLGVKIDFALTDCMDIGSIPHESIVHGDAISQSISAASIIAKVTRDELMAKYDEIYPEYDFKNNQGYGTKKHLEALMKYGPTPIHRLSYQPVKNSMVKQLSLFEE
ncbi:ribonuclease HII [Acholeplasma hippikon]|uniref:Ribonuclease HII n=1 Tax=Acholeplasma hippikon TaxID=264636 RepID=A0A449BJM3_9MOLU|nr:ribonuclease HII [Acholeplasma hippikon]VEU82652.1 ribonuclease H [Acholeplasma hippikon]